MVYHLLKLKKEITTTQHNNNNDSKNQMFWEIVFSLICSFVSHNSFWWVHTGHTYIDINMNIHRHIHRRIIELNVIILKMMRLEKIAIRQKNAQDSSKSYVHVHITVVVVVVFVVVVFIAFK